MKILRILLKKILDQLITIVYKNFRIICKNIVYKDKNNKNILLPNYYIKFFFKKSLDYK